MLRSELHKLERIIDGIGPGRENADLHVKGDRLAEQMNSFRTECARIMAQWSRYLFSPVPDIVMYRYVQFHQKGLIRMSDQLSRVVGRARGHAPKSAEEQSPSIELLDGLNRLIGHLKGCFYKYFDEELKLSLVCYPTEIVKVRNNLSSLESRFERSDIDPDLARSVSTFIEKQIHDAEILGLSYAQLNRLNDLDTLVKAFDGGAGGLNSADLGSELFRLNFNAFEFMVWYTGEFQRRLNTLNEPGAEVQLLSAEIKKFENKRPGLRPLFDPEMLSADQQMLHWLKERVSAYSGLKDRKMPKMIESVTLEISVAQLAFFLKLFYHQGCFATANVSGLLRSFCQLFSTRKQAAISFKSIRRSFYNVDQATAATVRYFLQEMIDYINRNYFPR